MVGEAVNVTFVPAQIVVAEAPILTEVVKRGFTIKAVELVAVPAPVTVMLPLLAVAGNSAVI